MFLRMGSKRGQFDECDQERDMRVPLTIECGLLRSVLHLTLHHDAACARPSAWCGRLNATSSHPMMLPHPYGEQLDIHVRINQSHRAG